MAIPNEKLQQLLQEISQKSAFAEQQLSIVRSQIAQKNRESRMLQLSSSEIESLPTETPVYDGVGKMFVLTTTTDVRKRQEQEAGDVKKQITDLQKKMEYLDTTFKNSQQHIDRILKGSG